MDLFVSQNNEAWSELRNLGSSNPFGVRGASRRFELLQSIPLQVVVTSPPVDLMSLAPRKPKPGRPINALDRKEFKNGSGRVDDVRANRDTQS